MSAKDEYEQYFLLNKKNVECTEKISSVFMLVVLIDEENLLDKTLLQSFRRRTCVATWFGLLQEETLSMLLLSAGTTGIHTEGDLLGNKLIAATLSS